MSTPSIRVTPLHETQASVLLEPADREDLAALWPLDESVYKYHSVDRLPVFENPDILLASFSLDHAWQIIVPEEEKRTRLIGVIGLSHIDDSYPRLGVCIMSPQQRGRGAGTCAAIGIGAYAVAIGLPRVRAETLAANLVGRRMLHRAGFVELPIVVGRGGKARESPYGDGSQTSSWTDWTMIPPDGSESERYLSRPEQDRAQAHFVEAQSAYTVTIE